MNAVDAWMENAAEPGKHAILDLGYITVASTRERGDRVMKYVGRANFGVAGASRLIVVVPRSKLARLLAALPIKTVSEQPGYCWTTHSWFDEAATAVEAARW